MRILFDKDFNISVLYNSINGSNVTLDVDSKDISKEDGTGDINPLPEEGDGTGDTDIAPEEGDGTGDINPLPEEGDGTGDTNIAPEEGDGTGDTDITPEEGDGTGDKDIAPEDGAGDVDMISEGGDFTVGGEGMPEGDMYGDMGNMEGGTTVKDPFLSSWIPVIGISTATLVVGVIIGILLAKRKIKKGIELYED